MNDVWNGESRGNSDVMQERIRIWHRDRNLIDGSTDKDQFCINIMERNNYSMMDCLETAWIDIKDRKGKMVDGIFVKEADL